MGGGVGGGGGDTLLERVRIGYALNTTTAQSHQRLTLCVSHQSMLGRPVTPDAFKTWVG